MAPILTVQERKSLQCKLESEKPFVCLTYLCKSINRFCVHLDLGFKHRIDLFFNQTLGENKQK